MKINLNTVKYCERKRNTSKLNYSKRMDNALTLFWRKTSDRKRDTPDRKLLLSVEIKAELKMLEGDLSYKQQKKIRGRRTWDS